MTAKNSFLNRLKLNQFKRVLQKINALGSTMRQLSDSELAQKTIHFKQRLQQGETLDDLLVEAFAVIREVDRRLLGMFPYDVQVLGAIALHYGYIAEMKTGEGKTLTATMPLYLNALEGKGAILVTANEYLAKRDAEEMSPVYEFMGLTVGVGVFDQEEDVQVEMKRAVYAADITYTTSSSLGFDYLIDNLAGDKDGKFIRPFHYAIIDEADAVLLDSAQTPLVISGSPRVPSNLYDISNTFVQTLKKDVEYHYQRDDHAVYLTDEGRQYAEAFFDIDNLYTGRYFELNRHINLALRAHHLYKKDVDYVVVESAVELLDNRTGRILYGTRLQSGIHQAIETKEGIRRTKDARAMGSITLQSLFKMFPKLAGMTGTGKMAENELIESYDLPVMIIPTNEPIRRIDYPDNIYVTLPEKLYATLHYVKTLHQKGQPVLLISGTVDIAEIYSRMLLQEGIPHNVLTAKNTAKEAQIIQEAGRKGAVTVATSLAGRGTDIKLGEGAAELGGLAVVGTERMSNSRIDWQLRGRAGRKGDPGLSQFFVSLEDELLTKYGSQSIKTFFEKHNTNQHKYYGKILAQRKFKRAIQHAQIKSEDNAMQSREFTVRFEASLNVQRRKVYDLRDALIYDNQDLTDKVYRVFHEVLKDVFTQTPQFSKEQLQRYVLENYTYHPGQMPSHLNVQKQVHVEQYLNRLFQNELKKKANHFKNKDKFTEFLRLAILKAVDECWIEQVDYLQQLKSFVTMRQIGQRDAIAEYYRESLESYDKMSLAIKHRIVKNLMLSTIEGSQEAGYSIYFV